MAGFFVQTFLGWNSYVYIYIYKCYVSYVVAMGKSCANLHLASVRLPVWGLYRMLSALFGEGFDLCDEALGCEVASTDVVVLCFFVCFARFWLFDFSAKCDAFMQRGYFFFERVHFVVDKK